MIRQSTIKNLRRKNLEVMIEKQLEMEQEARKKLESP